MCTGSGYAILGAQSNCDFKYLNVFSNASFFPQNVYGYSYMSKAIIPDFLKGLQNVLITCVIMKYSKPNVQMHCHCFIHVGLTLSGTYLVYLETLISYILITS